MGDAWVKDLEHLNTDWIKEYLTTAPYLIVVFKQIYGTNTETGERITHHYHEISVSIACGILITGIVLRYYVELVTKNVTVLGMTSNCTLHSQREYQVG